MTSVGFYAATSTAAFAPYNPSWDGTSDFRTQLEADPTVETELTTRTTDYNRVEPNETVSFVIAPDEPYAETDVQRISQFVDRGGTLVVLENFGTSGDQLLFGLGTEAQVDGQLLRDERNHQNGPTMPIATDVTTHPLTDGVDQLSLNYASAVNPGNATVLVATSEYAYLGNETTDLEDVETLESYPVATVESVGDGQVVVVSDPSLVINAMIGQPDNDAFVRGLYTGNDHALIDVSKSDDVPPLIGALLTVRGSVSLQLLLGGLGVAAVATIWRKPGRSVMKRTQKRLPRPSSQRERADATSTLTHTERLEFLRLKYPDWDDERIERVATVRDHTRGR
ncbi:DUF4350 domain-containing protein [Natronosalvus vescus]|uniref:DUF4350 domain-containing protein n=1 Tax=Natronosalvus vescus TaxID=2953881 RepID=UPI0020919ECA|nr:DUF4350 domain-containing protein [Natronosalvus vescus]